MFTFQINRLDSHVTSDASFTVDIVYIDAFRESEHPRGQPANKGEFVAGSGATGPTKNTASAHLKPAPPDRAQWPKHIQALRIPPAWKDVHISHDPLSPLQAIGEDAAGRKQYVYARHFAQSQAAIKFARISQLEKQIAKIDAKNKQNQQSKDPVVRDHADAVALIISMGIRPGSTEDTKSKVKAYGATTLEGRHVKQDKAATRLSFIGKKGVALDLPVDDPHLAKMLQQRSASAGTDGQLFPHVTAASMLNYVHEFGSFKSKDFRTLLATKLAHAEVQRNAAPTNEAQYKKAVMQVAKTVAARLGNTPTVALQSYISPQIFSEWRNGIGSEHQQRSAA